jgi:peptidoglycan hydrolase-like protein with peptidoglycan-binding domain
MITLGDKGPEVSQLQKHLSMLGYDLIIDGHFGNRTLRSLKAFQKKYGLLVDGIAGPKTFSALKAAQKRTSKEDKNAKYGKNYGDLDVDVNHNQPAEQYIKQVMPKDKVFIHYTVSGPDAKGVIKYWDRNVERVSTAFVMSGRGSEDGKVYESFNPDYWSYHLGIKGSKGKLDRSSIGIEICAWGRLDKKGDKFFNAYGGEVSSDEVYTLDTEWRGKVYYHAYSDKQLESLEKLLLWIIKEYKIPVQDTDFNRDWAEYSDELVVSGTPGIWTHTNVRKDKQDTYPDQRLFDMLNRIRVKVNGK